MTYPCRAKHPCVDCGRLVWPESQRCSPCRERDRADARIRYPGEWSTGSLVRRPTLVRCPE
jgi:uncharacterized OB-fold protein